MNSECKEYKLGDIGIFEYGKLPDKKLIGLGDYKIFTGYKITDKYPVFNCNEGDIVIVARGVGGTGDVKLAPRKCYLTNLSIKITLNEKFIDKKYFYYNYLLSNLKYLDSGSVQSQITISDLKNITLKLPDIKIQKDISLILSTIDSKISINNNINQNLECIAQTLFKSWFVDFDPVKAKIAAKEKGKDPQLAAMIAISGKTAEDINKLPADKRKKLAETADLFPDVMIESELGMIPKEWKVGKIGDIYSSKGGYAFKSDEFTNEGFPVVKIKNITNFGYVDLNDTQKVKLETVKSKESFILQDGDVIMAMTGATIGKVGIISNYTNINCYQNQRVAKFSPINKLNNLNWFVYLFFKKEENLSAIISMAQGSAQPNISTTGIDGISAIIPSIKLLNRFNLAVDPLFKTWISNAIQSNKLSETRNLLLPELISGKLSLNI